MYIVVLGPSGEKVPDLVPYVCACVVCASANRINVAAHSAINPAVYARRPAVSSAPNDTAIRTVAPACMSREGPLQSANRPGRSAALPRQLLP